MINMENNRPDYYFRQWGALGTDALDRISQTKVLISGLRGVGVEAAKSLIQIGPQIVIIHDDNLVTANDIAANYCLNEADVG